MGSISNICILGGGNGAHAISGDLAMRGFKVRMCELPEFEDKFKRVISKSEVKVTGIKEGIARLQMGTTDFSIALIGVELIIVAVPSFAHRTFIKRALPYLQEGQIVLFTPGNLSTLEAYQLLKESGKERSITLAETCTLPYGCRVVKEGHVQIMIEAKKNPLAAFPANRTEEVVRSLKTIYSAIMNGGNVLQVALSNPNPTAHPIATILNCGRIEFADHFYLYREGFTPSVNRVVEAADNERKAVLDKLGMKALEPLKTKSKHYNPVDSVRSFFGEGSLEAGRQMEGPLDLNDRYVTEDIPYGLKLVSSLGKLLGVATPVVDSIITIASVINKQDYLREGRTLKELGLDGLTAEQIRQYVETGMK
jgi:opine dehydrogenase